MILIYRSSGGVEVDPGPVTLEKLQKIVAGYIETVPVIVNGKDYIMVLDEMGKLYDKDINHVASRFLAPHDYAVGDVAIVRRQGEELVGLRQKDLVSFALAVAEV